MKKVLRATDVNASASGFRLTFDYRPVTLVFDRASVQCMESGMGE